MKKKRQAGERLGRHAEEVAAYRILARRHKSHLGEVDLIARRGRLLVFAEVKARATLAAAAEALGPRQRRRIARAAAHYQARLPAGADCRIRFDLVLVRPWRWPVHVADAWRPDETGL
jgi:putative endonuclease